MPSAGMGVNTGRKTLSEFLPRGIKAYSLPYYHARGGIIAAPSPCFRVDGLEMPPRMTSKKIIVALDIETTGLNPDKDAVIEIGMIRCRGDREEARWASLVNPDTVDTYELASALLPRAPRYNLGALCAHLGIPASATHRALDDAFASFELYRRLGEVARTLPTAYLAEMVRFGQ